MKTKAESRKAEGGNFSVVSAFPLSACRFFNWMLNVPKIILLLALRIYRLTISPAQMVLFGNTFGCRFSPTCSAYALEAVREHGAVTGTVLAAKRICRCHPWGGCGHDPVPAKQPVAALKREALKRSYSARRFHASTLQFFNE